MFAKQLHKRGRDFFRGSGRRQLRLRTGDRKKTGIIKGWDQKETAWMEERVASCPEKYCLAFRSPEAAASP